MISKAAIEKAIEGGWSLKGYDFHYTREGVTEFRVNDGRLESRIKQLNEWNDLASVEEIALDPSFWQALGKALGWDPQSGESFRTSEAFYKAHRFYDLILTAQDTQKFWDELLI